MITAVLGAPGSGKITLALLLVALLPAHVVLDWDAFMSPAAMLGGRDIRQHPATWTAYRKLVHTIVGVVARLPVVFSRYPPRTNSPAGRSIHGCCWIAPTRNGGAASPFSRPKDAGDAIRDAHEYRALGLRTIETAGWEPELVAQAIAQLVQNDRPQHRPI